MIRINRWYTSLPAAVTGPAANSALRKDRLQVVSRLKNGKQGERGTGPLPDIV